MLLSSSSFYRLALSTTKLGQIRSWCQGHPASAACPCRLRRFFENSNSKKYRRNDTITHANVHFWKKHFWTPPQVETSGLEGSQQILRGPRFCWIAALYQPPLYQNYRRKCCHLLSLWCLQKQKEKRWLSATGSFLRPNFRVKHHFTHRVWWRLLSLQWHPFCLLLLPPGLPGGQTHLFEHVWTKWGWCDVFANESACKALMRALPTWKVSKHFVGCWLSVDSIDSPQQKRKVLKCLRNFECWLSVWILTF